jgi:hypothetical protein
MADKRHQEFLGATGSAPRPGQYPLGSAASRAAARATLDARSAAEGLGALFELIRIPCRQNPRCGDGGPPAPGKCTCPMPPAGTFAWCRCFE